MSNAGVGVLLLVRTFLPRFLGLPTWATIAFLVIQVGLIGVVLRLMYRRLVEHRDGVRA